MYKKLHVVSYGLECGLKLVSIRRIQGLGYGVLGFLRVGTTFDIFQNIHILYLQYGVLVFTGYVVLIMFPLWSLRSAGTHELLAGSLKDILNINTTGIEAGAGCVLSVLQGPKKNYSLIEKMCFSLYFAATGSDTTSFPQQCWSMYSSEMFDASWGFFGDREVTG
ncbi:hypothetical protein Tco_0657815 [Tanacetum coccineum]